MKRRTISVALALVALALAPGVTLAAVGDAKGPRCSDVVGGDLAYVTSVVTGEPTVVVFTDTAAPSCHQVSYVLTVYPSPSEGATSSVPLTTVSLPGDGTTNDVGGGTIDLVAAVPAGHEFVCVEVATMLGKHVADATDGGCIVLRLDGPPPGRGGTLG